MSTTQAQLAAYLGKELFCSDWLVLDLEDEVAFQQASFVREDYLGFPLESTDPYGERLLSGFLLMSLLVAFHKKYQPIDTRGGYALNYGADRIRFVAPALAGEKLRCRAELIEYATKEAGKHRLLTRNTIEKDNGDVVMVADWITYLVEGSDVE